MSWEVHIAKRCDVCKRRVYTLKRPYAITLKRWTLCKECFLRYGDALPYLYLDEKPLREKKEEALKSLGLLVEPQKEGHRGRNKVLRVPLK